MPPPPVLKQTSKPSASVGKRKRDLATPESIETPPGDEPHSSKALDSNGEVPSQDPISAITSRPSRTRSKPARYAEPLNPTSPPPAKKGKTTGLVTEKESTPSTASETSKKSPPTKRGRRTRATSQQAPSVVLDTIETLPPVRASKKRKSDVEQYLTPDSLSPDTRDTRDILPPSKKAKTADVHAALETHVTTPAIKLPGKSAKTHIEQLPNPGTIIIGAGIIGLFIALELAEKTSAGDIAHDITVVDINNGPSQLASGHCAGILNAAGMKTGWSPLQDVSDTQWRELLASKSFRKSTAFAEQVYQLSLNESDAASTPVSWIRKHVGPSCAQDLRAIGSINPKMLSRWLQSHCEHLGVKFLFNEHPFAVERSSSGDLTGIHVEQWIERKRLVKTLPCKRMVIVAGPFSQDVLETLFPDRKLALDNDAILHQWMRINGIRIPRESNVGVILDMPDSETSTGPVQFAARRHHNAVEVSRCSRKTPDDIITHKDACRTRIGSTSEVRRIAGEILSSSNGRDAHLRNIGEYVHQANFLISTGNEGNPVIGKVPDWVTSATDTSGETGSADVWLAYGFGNYGTTLAPGVGRLLVQAMSGEEPEVDLYDFAVTEMEQSKPEFKIPTIPASASKGKGKQRALS